MNQPEARKKPYQTPKMVAYGDLRAITQTKGNTGDMDGGFGQKTTIIQ